MPVTYHRHFGYLSALLRCCMASSAAICRFQDAAPPGLAFGRLPLLPPRLNLGKSILLGVGLAWDLSTYFQVVDGERCLKRYRCIHDLSATACFTPCNALLHRGHERVASWWVAKVVDMFTLSNLFLYISSHYVVPRFLRDWHVGLHF
jgi:hypothetical protein